MTTVGFTGHRPNGLYGYDSSMYDALRNGLRSLITKLATHPNVKANGFYSGGAQGGDMLFFQAVEHVAVTHNIPISNTVIEPFAGQESGWRKDGLFGRDDFDMMLKAASEVVVASNEHSARSYHLRNHMIVDRSNLMIALLDVDAHGEVEDWRCASSGGTVATVRYAYQVNKPIIVIDRDGIVRDVICDNTRTKDYLKTLVCA